MDVDLSMGDRNMYLPELSDCWIISAEYVSSDQFDWSWQNKYIQYLFMFLCHVFISKIMKCTFYN